MHGSGREMHMNIRLSVPQILQNPELPNGCEITSCCEVLRFLGFDADKCVLADKYLPRSENWYGTDPNYQYMGNPHLDSNTPDTGYYCFAGPIVEAANRYLSDEYEKRSPDSRRYHAVDLTGCDEEELTEQLEKGNPFIFWASLHFQDIQFDSCAPYPLRDGSMHRVFHQLHCMVCCGADDENFYIADPLDYNTAVPRAQFMKIYRQLGSRAVVIA